MILRGNHQQAMDYANKKAEKGRKRINKYMPLTKNISKNIKELYKDNLKSGRAKGAGGKPRSRAQIIAIAISASKKKK